MLSRLLILLETIEEKNRDYCGYVGNHYTHDKKMTLFVTTILVI